ncbi:MAG TPA: exodeoxyribonuclease V subunit gamma [Smithella sp.]|nr:exodeoxyribonuclease V subunit gamma [Smithella sp.]
MKLFISNRLDVLAARLAEILNSPLHSPFATETIIVQSKGMEKWLSLELAQNLGICANCRFPFPHHFIEEVFGACIPGYKPDLFYEEDVLAWKIMEILPSLQCKKDFTAVRNYLGKEPDQIKLYQLSRRIANLYDQYLVFRPEMILAWEEGKVNREEKWQAQLWQEINANQSKMHKARLQQLFMERAENAPLSDSVLPMRITVFGISYLPVYYLRIYNELSRHMEVNLFYLNPSQEFWADIKSEREISRMIRQAPTSNVNIEEELFHLDEGNALLASWGTAGRDFFRLTAGLPAQSEDLFVEPETENVLTAIQSDIYYLRSRGKNGFPQTRIAEDDNSIQIHSCHSPLRETETLHDTLLSLFEENSGLLPKDILVMTPSIEEYTPYIEAVFESRKPAIPYTVADRGISSGSAIFKDFFALLGIGKSRLAVAEVLSLLENPAIGAKFGISGFDLNLIRHWVEETNIKWGLDSAHRQEYGLPEFDQNTWSAGLARIKLGIAMAGQNKELFDGILPYDEIEGQQTELFGRFLDFFESLMRTKKILNTRRNVGDWAMMLKSMADEFFAAGENYQQDIFALNKVLLKLLNEQKYMRADAGVELDVIKHYLEMNLDKNSGSAHFLAGSVTFCALLPMRSIPFKVIALIGMNNDAYPRQDRKTGFDLMASKKRTGDKSLRNDDRYLFLEAVLSAGNNLIISYVGQDVQDNSTLLPSVLVSELTDYINQGFCMDSGVRADGALTRLHHLHAFHTDYYHRDRKLFTYSRESYAAALINNNQGDEPRFCTEAAANSEIADNIITISDLDKFYKNPVKYYLEKKLLLKLPEDRKDDEYEPFDMNNLQAYQIKQELIAAGDESAAENIFQIKRAQGLMPVGAAGDYYFQIERKEANDFIRRYASYFDDKKIAPLEIDIDIGEYHIVGEIDDVYTRYSLGCRPARIKAYDYFKAWLNHLLLNHVKAKDYPRTAIVIGEDAAFQFRELENAGVILNDLVDLFIEGQTRPLKLFPKSSFAYAEALYKGETHEQALQKAKDDWLGDNFGRAGEADKVENIICFGRSIPLDADFMKNAVRIFNVLFEHREKLGYEERG